MQDEPTTEHRYTLAELAATADVAPRTVRFYIARGLLPPATTVGRHATYGGEHESALRRIKALQAEGLTLGEIGLRLGDGARGTALPDPEATWRFRLAEDVTVEVRAGASPWRARQIKRALESFAHQLSTEVDSNADD